MQGNIVGIVFKKEMRTPRDGLHTFNKLIERDYEHQFTIVSRPWE